MANGAQQYFANFTNVKANKLKIGIVTVNSTSGIYLYFGATADNNFIDLTTAGEWDISAYDEIHFRVMGNSGAVYIGEVEFI